MFFLILAREHGYDWSDMYMQNDLKRSTDEKDYSYAGGSDEERQEDDQYCKKNRPRLRRQLTF